MKKVLSIIIILCLFLVGCGDKTCTNHESSDWIITKEATCNELGEKIKKCLKCEEVLETEQISITGHKETIIEGKEATCLEKGYTEEIICSVCNTIIKAKEDLSPLGHTYNLNEDKSNDEVLVYECIRCKDSYENKNTTGCINHIESDWIITKEATCLESGIKEKKCTKCDVLLKQEIISALNHKEETMESVKATCESIGLTEGIKCSRCNKIIKAQEEIPALGHNYEIVNTIASTKETHGYIEYKCDRCNETYKEELPLASDFDETKPISIILSDNNIVINNNNGGVLVTNNTIKIVLAGEYTLSGKLSEGNVLVSTGDDDKVYLNLENVTISSSITNPIYIENADKVEISAKSKTNNYIYDNRVYDENSSGACIYAKCDLELKGKGSLNIETSYNNGLMTSKDLKIKNLTLNVLAKDNAIKGNDSITIDSGTIKAISTQGDALKTKDSDISSKGNQRGNITINDGTITLYAACDGIDASCDVIINGGKIDIYTDKYSEYSEEVLVTSTKLYIRLSQRMGPRNNYTFTVKFYDENNNETSVNAKTVNDGPMSYAVLDKPQNVKTMIIYAYNNGQTQGGANYTACSDLLTIPESKDLYSISNISSSYISGNFGNYTNSGSGRPGFGPGGMQDGNSDKALYSCKGIKSDNEIIINGGTINIKSHDDAIHTNNTEILENGNQGKGNIYINSGTLVLYCDDDGIHADNYVYIKDGNITIEKSYEGVEGEYINFEGGVCQIKSSDDGINSKTNLNITGGLIYIDADGDGLDSNGTITMSGGTVLAIGPGNGGNGVLDFDRTFTFSGGLLLAIGCRGMDQKPTATTNALSTSQTISTSTSSYVSVIVNNEVICSIKVTKQNQNYCVLAYDKTLYNGAKVSISTSIDETLINNLYYVK